MKVKYVYACFRCNKAFDNKQTFVEHVWRKHGHRVVDVRKCIQTDNNNAEAGRTEVRGSAKSLVENKEIP
jgi:DNA-directed RNA polymerase subunit RPC12/RpoP